MSRGSTGYNGQGFSLRGEKDRFVLPASFRKVFAEKGDEGTLCVAVHHELPCLLAFGPSRTEDFDDLLDKEEENAVRRDLDFDRDLRATQMWSFIEVPFDKSGRFILPPRFCKVGGIGDNICFLGGGKFITLWDIDKLGEMDGFWAVQHDLCLAEAEDARAKAAAKAGKK